MINFGDIKDKASEIAKNVVGITSDAAQIAADKSKKAAKIARLSIENTTETEKIKKLYAEIGKLYCELYADLYDVAFADMMQQIQQSNEKIAANRSEIDALRASEDDFVDSEFEDIAQDAEDKVEEVSEKLEDIAEEAKDKIEDVVEKLTDSDD